MARVQSAPQSCSSRSKRTRYPITSNGNDETETNVRFHIQEFFLVSMHSSEVARVPINCLEESARMNG
ncbi:unnamed protein product [Lathyrus oleraceus]